jgi:hypothetical protein
MAATAQALRRRTPASLTCSLLSFLLEEVEEVEGGGRYESAATIAGIAFSPLTAAAVSELDTTIAVAVARRGPADASPLFV